MLEDPSERPRGIRLFIHGILPTKIGLLCYLLVAVLLTMVHILMLSISGTAYPASFDDTLLQSYANVVIQPLATIVNNELFDSFLTLVLWGIAGSIICATVATLDELINDWRNTEEDITVPTEGVVIHHPLKRSLIIRLSWRLFIGILVVLFTALMLPVVRFCLANDVSALNATSFFEGFYRSVMSVLIWMTILHGYIILFRLYVLRTRLFGEILY